MPRRGENPEDPVYHGFTPDRRKYRRRAGRPHGRTPADLARTFPRGETDGRRIRFSAALYGEPDALMGNQDTVVQPPNAAVSPLPQRFPWGLW